MQIGLNRTHPLFLLFISLFIILVITPAFQNGMFMDGQQYACVAKNFYLGKGSFWKPELNSIWNREGSANFMEHPPLGYFVQSMFFHVLGASLYTERIFNVVILFALFFTIYRIQLLSFGMNFYSSDFYFTSVLLLSVPVFCWSFINNMLEAQISLYSLLAFYFSLKTISTDNLNFNSLCLSAFFSIACFLTKGIAGLFPILFLPALYIIKNKKNEVRKFAIFYALIIIFSGFLLMNNSSRDFFSFYFQKRFLHRIQTEIVASYRLEIIVRLISELLPTILLLGVTMIFTKIKQTTIKIAPDQKMFALIFLLIALSASVPLTFTHVQKGFYLTPSFPFYVLSACTLLKNNLKAFGDYINNNKFIRALSFIILLLSILYFMLKANKPKRDEDLIQLTEKIGQNIPSGAIIKISEQTYNLWSLQFYLNRSYEIAMDPNASNSRYLLLNSNDSIGKYDLFKYHLLFKQGSWDLYEKK